MRIYKSVQKRKNMSDIEDACRDAEIMLEWGMKKSVEELKNLKWGNEEGKSNASYNYVPLILFTENKDFSKSKEIWQIRYDFENHTLHVVGTHNKETIDSYGEIPESEVIPMIKNFYNDFGKEHKNFTTGSFAGFVEKGLL